MRRSIALKMRPQSKPGYAIPYLYLGEAYEKKG